MKKTMCVCLILGLLCSLWGCSQALQPETTACGHEVYADLIARLEAKDYAGAYGLIAAMEQVSAASETAIAETAVAEPAAAQPEAVISADTEVVELTRDNVREYFEFTEEFQIGEQSWCTQYIRLKEEYRSRLISVEDVFLQVSCLRCEAYGSIDLEEEEFRPEYYDPVFRDKEFRVLELEKTGSAWLTGMTVFSDRGCFSDYAMDVEIESGSGTLVLSAK